MRGWVARRDWGRGLGRVSSCPDERRGRTAFASGRGSRAVALAWDFWLDASADLAATGSRSEQPCTRPAAQTVPAALGGKRFQRSGKERSACASDCDGKNASTISLSSAPQIKPGRGGEGCRPTASARSTVTERGRRLPSRRLQFVKLRSQPRVGRSRRCTARSGGSAIGYEGRRGAGTAIGGKSAADFPVRGASGVAGRYRRPADAQGRSDLTLRKHACTEWKGR